MSPQVLKGRDLGSCHSVPKAAPGGGGGGTQDESVGFMTLLLRLNTLARLLSGGLTNQNDGCFAGGAEVSLRAAVPV